MEGIENPEIKARNLIYAYIDELYSLAPEQPRYDVKLVWFCKTLQNWKAILITTLPDNFMYEVSYNGDKKETYLDIYEKRENRLIPDAG